MLLRICSQRIPLLLATALVTILMIAPTAHADCEVDQEQALGSLWVMVVGEVGTTLNRAAQTFTVGFDGVLSEIHIRGTVPLEPAGTGPLTLEIFPTTAGAPDESGGALFTKVIPFSSLPVGVVPTPEIVFDVSAGALPVAAGEVFAVSLSVPDGVFSWTFRPGAPYAAGTLWTREESASTWTDDEVDGFFRTVVCRGAVSVDEPVLLDNSWSETKSAYRD